MKTAIEIVDLTVSYGGLRVLSGLTASIPWGQLTAVMGPNGSGKSTLLKAVLGLMAWDRGQVRILGQPPARVRGRVAYVPQGEEIDLDFPVLVEEIVLMGRLRAVKPWRRPGPQDRQAAREALRYLGLEGMAGRPLSQLSGGQRQRVFLARALAARAQVLFLDEPLNGVDVATQEIMLTCLRKIKEAGITVMMVHHRLEDVRDHFDKILLLNQRLVAFGDASEALVPESIQEAYGTWHMPLWMPSGD